jgi:serine/threonine-protein kinase
LFHGSLCPRDLLLGTDGVCRVADLAASAALRAVGAQGLGNDPGKLAYVSPELLLGQPLDARSDVFSVGAILHDVLTGAELFGAPSVETVRSRVLERVVEPPSRVGLRPPEAFDAICLRALERDPERRFASIRELLLALEEVALEQDTLASSSELSAWISSAFGRELELRRLSVLDASRRSRANSRAPASLPPPPASAVPPHMRHELPNPPSAIVSLRHPPSVQHSASTAIVLSRSANATVPTLQELNQLSSRSPRRRDFPYRFVAASFAIAAAALGAFWVVRGGAEPSEEPEGSALATREPAPAVVSSAAPVLQPPPTSSAPAAPVAEPPAPISEQSSGRPAGKADAEPDKPRSRVRWTPPRRQASTPPLLEPTPQAQPASTAQPTEAAPAGEAAPSRPEPSPAPPSSGSESEFRYGI